MRLASALAVAIGWIGFATAASAAGSFDGTWSGEAVGTGPAHSCTAPASGTVANNTLHAVIAWGRFKPSAFTGTIDASGHFQSSGGRISGAFTGNSFVGTFSVPNGYCNPYKLTLDRS